MKFRYTGDCEGMTFRGYAFPINEPVDVKEDDIINKLSNNSHFTEVKKRKAKAVEDGDSSRHS